MNEPKSGRCRICEKIFLALEKDEYQNAVSRHIIDNHRDEPPDKVIVEGLKWRNQE